MKTFLAIASFVVLLATGVHAKTFTGNWNVSGSALTDPGLVVQTYPSSGTTSFDLDVGESTTFNLFAIWTDETWVNGDDTVPQSLNVSFNMTDPVTSGTLPGTTVGGSALFGIIQWGSISWSNPLQLYFGPGGAGLLTISLSDEIFNLGFFGLGEGKRYGAIVEATATYSISPVPLPATAFLLLGGLAGLGVMRRRRRVV